MLRIALRRFTMARVWAMTKLSLNERHALHNRASRVCVAANHRRSTLELRLEVLDRRLQQLLVVRRQLAVPNQLVADVGLLLAHVRQELVFPRGYLVARD